MRSVKMRKFSMLLMIVGVFIIGFAGYQIVGSKIAEKQGITEAKEMLGLENVSAAEPGLERKYSSKRDFLPGKGDLTGLLNIEKIGAELPIYEGVDDDELDIGVGHYPGTSYPLENDQIVLSGHRDTVFRKMGELEIGDIMTLALPYGDFDYEIVETYIVDAEDRTVIVPHDEEILTVTTCYPFTYVGSAPDRYIINAVPVNR